MFKKSNFVPKASIAVLLVCGFACAQENGSKTGTHEEKVADVAQPKAPNVPSPSPTPTPTTPPTQIEDTSVSQEDLLKASRAFGHFIGRNLKNPGIHFDIDKIIEGMRDGYAGKPSQITDSEYEALMSRIQEQAHATQSKENLKAADAFLEKNKHETGVIELEPGKLQYLLIQEGNGPVVQEHSAPQIHYKGQFLDGTVFGSSQESGEPITIPLDQTIPGFSKGILGMKEGEKRKLFVHPNLGYGTAGHLPPNSLLIFEVEVVKATPPDASQASDDDFGDLEDDEDGRFDDEDKEHEEDSTGHKKPKSSDPSVA